MSTTHYLADPSHLRRVAHYFLVQGAGESATPYIRHGAELAEKIIALIDNPHAVPGEVDAILASFDSPEYNDHRSGKAWFELELAARQWARDRGYTP